MLDSAVDHLMHNVMPSAADYSAAEDALSRAYAADATPATWEPAGWHAKRQAENLAVAIDGLTDRSANELGIRKPSIIRASVAKLCVWPGTVFLRPGCIERMQAVASAYRHGKLSDPRLPISSDRDVLAVGRPYGTDAYGVGKYGGVEVLVRDKDGKLWVFMADAPAAVVGWTQFLAANGAKLPPGPLLVCGVRVHPCL